ncbi:NAD-dependent epimerase/dehydratase family protein [Flavobacterium limi]|uniref:Nucleoside-diphosphate-sugar epimerase n=1 Tax=Flavobacterium limi TaxID=2045105 RepID=A0ABQ1U369_9FLAO|nr:NAD-dependent epimerase/dehydratase family protein [Flavobacterium limi]GGF08225.1 nucleoside-diphosphate-sugar epimerase [Flavobacterium limi]
MKVIITGVSGFVGQNLQDYLKKDHEIDSLSVRYKENQQFDLKGDVIIHLAGKAHDLKKVSKPQDYYEANYELTKQLFDSFLNSEVSIFIFMSTVKAVADEVVGVLTEEMKPNPKTHYGIAKHQSEKYILSKELPVGKKIYILRPCMIHGPGNKGNLNLLYQLIVKGFPWPLGAFKNQRSFLSIENLCFVIKELLEQTTIPSGIYNVADDDHLSTNELIIIMGESLRKKVNILKIPIKLIETMALLGNFLKLPLNREKLQKLTESYIVDNKKINSKIGKPLPMSSREGLKITFDFFRKNT